MSRTLKQQMGLEADPHAPEHVMTGGQRLTKVYTQGGHEQDSGQPGLPTYHRRIANPFPLFAIGIGASLLILGLVFVEARGLRNPQIFLNIGASPGAACPHSADRPPRAGLPLGGVGVLTAMVFSFVEGNTFLTTAAGSLGGLVGGVSLIFLPWTGIQG